eukprot:g38294.t1
MSAWAQRQRQGRSDAPQHSLVLISNTLKALTPGTGSYATNPLQVPWMKDRTTISHLHPSVRPDYPGTVGKAIQGIHNLLRIIKDPNGNCTTDKWISHITSNGQCTNCGRKSYDERQDPIIELPTNTSRAGPGAGTRLENLLLAWRHHPDEKRCSHCGDGTPHLVFMAPQPDESWVRLDDAQVTIISNKQGWKFLGRKGIVLIYNQTATASSTTPPDPPELPPIPTHPTQHQDLCDAHPAHRRDPEIWQRRVTSRAKKLRKLAHTYHAGKREREKHVLTQHALSLLNQAIYAEERMSDQSPSLLAVMTANQSSGHISPHSTTLRKYRKIRPELPPPPSSWIRRPLTGHLATPILTGSQRTLGLACVASNLDLTPAGPRVISNPPSPSPYQTRNHPRGARTMIKSRRWQHNGYWKCYS